jgi:hypothetical protein
VTSGRFHTAVVARRAMTFYPGTHSGVRLRVQVVIEPDDDEERDSDRQTTIVREVAAIRRDTELRVDTLGLQLAEAKDLLQRVQEVVIDEQVRSYLAEQLVCQQCGRQHAHKDTKDHRHAHAVRHRAIGLSTLAPLLVRVSANAHVLPTGRGAARTRDSRAAVSRKQVRRADLVWPECQPARRDPAARPYTACLSEVQQQLGHARIDTTTIYTKLAARDRLAVHASVEW